MKQNSNILGALIREMRSVYAEGGNVMQFARQQTDTIENETQAIEIAYDLQAGTYIDWARQEPSIKARWCNQIADILSPLVNQNTSLLEIGCGEATTLAGVVNRLNPQPNKVFGFDISWSRCVHANKWLNEKKVNAEIFVSDLFEIPFQDSSIDIVYTSHSLEPNGGQELLALKELLRVARRKVVLIEPLFELASTAAQKRMEEHGYVKNLKGVAESLGFSVSHYGLLDFIENPLNPSGMLVIDKTDCVNESLDHSLWRCPMTHFPLEKVNECFYSAEGGILYPIVEGVPMLHQKNAIIGSAFEAMTKR